MKRRNDGSFVFAALILIISIALCSCHSRKREEHEKEYALSRPSARTQSDGAAFHGIPPEGDGGDPDLNRMKNRWTAPTSTHPYSVDDIIAFPHDKLSSDGRDRRDRWNSSVRAEANRFESQGVVVEGYLIAAKESEPESCNGHSEVYRDFHIWIGSSPNASKGESIIVEMTPFWKEQYPEWTLRRLESRLSSHPKVRVTGWILWDEEHPDEVGRSRGSQWEVHPVTKFEEIEPS